MQEISIYLKLQVEFSPAFQDHNFVSDYRIQNFLIQKERQIKMSSLLNVSNTNNNCEEFNL